MGFSPSTGQYKLFRLCFRHSGGWPETWVNYMEVYTFGEEGGGPWRRHQHMFPYSMVPRVQRLPPVLVDGKLYVLMEGMENRWVPKPDRMLVIDVASEAHVTYRLPEEFTGENTASVYAFELDGRLCVARRVAKKQLVHFLVMEPPRIKLQDHKKGRSLYGRWELRYTFNIDEFGSSDDGKLSSAWLDNDKMLRYRLGESLYIYDTTKDDEWKMKNKKVGDFSWWDYQIQLPVAPNDQRWNVYGGYRPSLLSPHHLVCRRNEDGQEFHHVFGRNDDGQEQFEHALAHALRWKQSANKRCSTCPPDSDNYRVPAAKRVRVSITQYLINLLAG
jgi:hypothetical protein